MRLFHVSDLHLGKTLHGYDLLEDQSFVLAGLVGKIREVGPDVLVIAGDVYDRAVPPVEAIVCFDRFLGEARAAAPGLEIVVIPGNHDSAGRLSFGASLLADSGVRIVTRAQDKPALSLSCGDGEAAVWALPFLTLASAPWEEGLRSQQDLMGSAIARMELGGAAGGTGGAAVNVLVAHCFAAGAVAGESELSFVGTAEQVDSGLFEGFDYVALGHLHSHQSPAPGIWYSGAPLGYCAGDAGLERGFLSVELKPGLAPVVEFIPLAPRRRIRRVSGLFRDLLANPLPEAERNDFIEVYLCDEEPVLDAGERLRELYPFLLGIPQRGLELRYGAGAAGEGGAPMSRGGSLTEDFSAFHLEMTGEAPSEAMVSLFEAIALEANVREAVDAAD